MSDYLPEETIAEILSRLPVKSLVRFMCVCKSWRALITSPDFIKIHLNQNRRQLLLLRYFSADPKSENYTVRSDSETLDEYDSFKCPFRARFYFRVVGICNGLVCLSDDLFTHTYNMIIWNPAIRRSVTLPKPSVNLADYGPYMVALGFGFDSLRNDYKVVRLAYLRDFGEDSLPFEATPKVEVYSLSTGSWRRIHNGVPSYRIVEFLWSQTFLNGFVHWVAYQMRGDSFHTVILSFDVCEEVFRVIEFPKFLSGVFPMHFSVGLCEDKLALFLYDNRVVTGGGRRCAVIVMREYGVVNSWSMLFTIDIEGGIWSALCLSDYGEVLLETRGNEMASYDPISKRVKSIGVRGTKDSLYAGAYAESLVLLNGVRGDLTGQDTFHEAVAAEERINENNLEKLIYENYIFAATSVMA